MLKGMTGFGRAIGHTPSGGRITVELRSLNHKFFETVFHLPDQVAFLEDDLKRIISGQVRRGRVNCSLNLSPGKNTDIVNVRAARQYVTQLRGLRKTLGLHDEIKIETILQMPGVLRLSVDAEEAKKDVPFIKEAVVRALKQLAGMRQKEGQAICRDFNKRLRIISGALKQVKVRIKKVVAQRQKSFASPEEYSAFLKNSDITEEIIRMEFHLKNFTKQINGGRADGKELDFVAQELQREINTVSAKSVDALISSSAVKIKSQVEKLREQLQNVE